MISSSTSHEPAVNNLRINWYHMDKFILNNFIVAKCTNYVMICGDRWWRSSRSEKTKICVRPTQRGRPVIILQVFAPTQRFLSGGLRFVSETVINFITVIIKFIFLINIVIKKIWGSISHMILDWKDLWARLGKGGPRKAWLTLQHSLTRLCYFSSWPC